MSKKATVRLGLAAGVLCVIGGLLVVIGGGAQGWIGVACGLGIIAVLLLDSSRSRR